MLLDRALACLGNQALPIYSQNLRQTSTLLKRDPSSIVGFGTH